MREPTSKRPISNLQRVVDRTTSAVQSTAYGGSGAVVDDSGPGAYPLILFLAIIGIAALILVAILSAIFARGR